MRKAVPTLLLVFLAASASSLDSKIAASCGKEYEPVISMKDPTKTYNNPGHPATYGQNVCVKGITEATIKTSCDGGTAFHLSSNDTSAHFFTSSGYNYHVCSSDLRAVVRSSCLGNETALFSVSSKDDAHVADTGVFDKEACGYLQDPKNISLEIEFNLSASDQVYFDDQRVGEGEKQLAEFPYMVSESSSHVAGIVADSMVSAERQLDAENRLKLQTEEGEFLVPFTEASHEDIEDRQDHVLSNNFMDELQPSFGFFMPEQPTVKVSLEPGVTLNSNLSLVRGSYTLKITKNKQGEIEIEAR